MAPRSLKLPASYHIAVSPTEAYVATIGRKVTLADVKTRTVLGSWKPITHPSAVAFSHSESHLVLKSTSGAIAIIQMDDGTVVVRHRAEDDEGANIHYSANEEYVVDASWSGEIRVRKASDLSLSDVFSFSDEMITEVSLNSTRDLWLFAHQRKTQPKQNFADPPYLTLWKWPLTEPLAKIQTGFDNLYSAVLSPCSRYIAMAGYSRVAKRAELRIMTPEGETIQATPITIGGTGFSTRWSPDSGFIGIVHDKAFSILEAPSLKTFAHLNSEFPSDLAFLENNSSVLLGTWKAGTLVPLIRDGK